MATNTTRRPGRDRASRRQPPARGARRSGRLRQQQAGARRAGPRHPAAVLSASSGRYLAPWPYQAAGPQGRLRQRQPAAAAVVARTTSSGRTSSGRDLLSRLLDGARISVTVALRRPGRHHRHRRADRRDRRLVRRPRGQPADAPDRRHLRVPRPAVHHPAVGGLPRDGLRPGAGRPAPRVRGDRPRQLGDRRAARPRPDAVAQGDRVRRGGQGDRRVAIARSSRKHLLPNGMGPIIVAITLGIPGAILAEATLAYIGIGVQPPRASWGSLIAEGQKFIRSEPHLVVFPAICHRPRADRLHLPGRRPARRARPEAQGKAIGGERGRGRLRPPTHRPSSSCPRTTSCGRGPRRSASAGVGRKAEHLLEVRGLSTHFFTPDGVVQAVDDVSFDVGYGETLGLVGESGCGKSVSALSIARLVPDPPGKIVAGSILFDGIDMLKLSDRRHAQAARQGDRVHLPGPADQPQPDADDRLPDRRVDPRAPGPVGEGGRATGSSSCWPRSASRDRRDRLNDYPFQFSGGMRQRVMIAIALVVRPEADPRRRADDRARRDDPGADPRAHPAAVGGVRHGRPDDHPRPRDRRRHVRPGQRHVRRPDRRDRHRRRRCSRTRACPTPGACSTRCRGSTTSGASGCARSRACRRCSSHRRTPAGSTRAAPYARDVCREQRAGADPARRRGPPGPLLGDRAGRVDRMTATATPGTRAAAPLPAARQGATSSRSTTSRSISRSGPGIFKTVKGIGQGGRRRRRSRSAAARRSAWSASPAAARAPSAGR